MIGRCPKCNSKAALLGIGKNPIWQCNSRKCSVLTFFQEPLEK